tara:strand:+ start:148 stop:366 length:219 start_codon:yes stop_codon:yes gene_type:complete
MPYHSTKKLMKQTTKKPMKKPKSGALTQKQKDMLKEASKNHTKKHIDFMKEQMKKGDSFTKAHNKALKKVGK